MPSTSSSTNKPSSSPSSSSSPSVVVAVAVALLIRIIVAQVLDREFLAVAVLTLVRRKEHPVARVRHLFDDDVVVLAVVTFSAEQLGSDRYAILRDEVTLLVALLLLLVVVVVALLVGVSYAQVLPRSSARFSSSSSYAVNKTLQPASVTSSTTQSQYWPSSLLLPSSSAPTAMAAPASTK